MGVNILVIQELYLLLIPPHPLYHPTFERKHRHDAAPHIHRDTHANQL